MSNMEEEVYPSRDAPFWYSIMKWGSEWKHTIRTKNPYNYMSAGMEVAHLNPHVLARHPALAKWMVDALNAAAKTE